MTQTSGQKWRQAYRKHGYALFPFRNIEGKKIPNPGWRYTTAKTHTDAVLSDQYGVCLSSDMLVIDADPRRYKGDVDSLKRLFSDLKIETPLKTFIVKSPRGGLHVYFTKPPGVDVVSQLEKDYPGIEFKTSGQFVVGCGSKSSYGYYTRARGSLDEIAEIPDALLDLIRKPETDTTQRAETEIDSKNNISRYIRYLKYDAPEAISGAGGNNTTYNVCCIARDMALSESTTFRLVLKHYNTIKCSPQWKHSELETIVKNVYKYAKVQKGGAVADAIEDFKDIDIQDEPGEEIVDDRPAIRFTTNRETRASSGEKPASNLANLVYYFWLEKLHSATGVSRPNPLYKLLRFNDFTGEPEFTRPAPWHSHYNPKWSDDDDVMFKFWLAHELHFDVATKLCYEASIAAARYNTYHPIKQEIEALEWDGEKRLSYLFSRYAGAEDTEYTRKVSRIIMIGAMARLYEPGCKFDTMVIMEGEQGSGKSTFVKILGGDWYKEIFLDTHKLADTIQRMQGGWIIETPELTFMKRADSNDMKFFLSAGCDSVRFAYGRRTREVPRKSVFLGTYNREPGCTGYLKDLTGNRRYLPVLTGKIDLEKLKEDRDQILAEAYHAYMNGEAYHIDSEQVAQMAMKEQALRLEQDPWLDILKDFVDTVPANRALTDVYLAENALGVFGHRLGSAMVRRIRNCMSILGYRREKVYCLVERSFCVGWVK